MQQDESAFREALQQHVINAIDLAGNMEYGKERKWSPMFIFTREIMRFNFPQNLRDDLDALADLLEDLHFEYCESIEKFTTIKSWDFWVAHADELKGEGRSEFLCTWSCMENQPGADPLLAAYALVVTSWKRGRMPGKSLEYSCLLAIAKQLQVIVGDRNILLPLEKLAVILNTSQMTMSRYIKYAVREGYLLLICPHHRAAKKAAEYRCVFERAKRPEERKFPAYGSQKC